MGAAAIERRNDVGNVMSPWVVLDRLANDDLWRGGRVLALGRRLERRLEKLSLGLVQMALRGQVVLVRRHLEDFIQVRGGHVVFLLVKELALFIVIQ